MRCAGIGGYNDGSYDFLEEAASVPASGRRHSEAAPEPPLKLKKTISRLRYKPGWNFGYRKKSGLDTLVITAQVQHSVTLEMVTFDVRRVIPEVAKGSLPAFLDWWVDILAEAELHELREFARYDGKLVDDPHASTPLIDVLAEQENRA